MIMKRKALEGMYLLAFIEVNKKIYKKQYQSIDILTKIENISEVTNTKKEIIACEYENFKGYLDNDVLWNKLKNLSRNVIADFEGREKDDVIKYLENYLTELDRELENKNARDKDNLLEGDKFGRIYNFELNEDKNKAKIFMSITTENIIKYDKTIINKDIPEIDKKYYRPYFIEFISEYHNVDDLNKKGIEINSSKDQWVKLNFDENCHVEGEDKTIEGLFIFSASPLKINKKKIEIIGVDVPEEIKNFNKLYLKNIENRVVDQTNIESSYLKQTKIFPDKFKKCEVTIFNVGQGSFNLIDIDNKKIIFDLGYSMFKGSSLEEGIKDDVDKLIKDIRPHCVILSHWDLDHILGITKMTDRIFDCYWIAPNITENSGFSDSAKRLICFLDWYNKTKLISIRSKKDNMNNCIIFSNNVFEIGKGKGNVVNSSLNYQNNFGLLLKVKGKKEEAIFAGDCEYIAFPKGFMKSYPEYLVVPHHGSKMQFDKSIDKSKSKIAFILAGKNHYKCERMRKCSAHPHLCHVNFLSEIGYKIYETKLTGFYKFGL